ncbi:DUF559 domain-containing protein [Microbacterium invictum]|uniref:Very-short-patch-repair endonuclease n=1 Tax=Microbacterium invictum TaxID=515415 RepID=A0AA40SNR8_9MICO|nr:DUF559 domain-containing protein [Microbacterium invictum]MBB4139583.1 very-short-patch-repair endonuclease [Microbacterium invictum]
MRTIEEMRTWLAARGGVAHTQPLRAAGFTTHGIRSALAAGAVRWVRRSWLATPDADPELRRAAQAGGRVTCLTGAQRLNLWTPSHEHLHLALPPTASGIDSAGLRLHWSRGPMPVGASEVADPVINVLFHAARCVAVIDALSVWESAIRQGRVSAQVLERVAWRSTRARMLAKVASDLSDSGLETRFAHLMRSIGVSVRQQVWIDGHPVDALVGETLVVQLDGFAHHQAADRRRDLRADARLVLLGYTVLRFDYYQVLFCADEVLTTVATAMAQGLHLAPARR